MAEPEVNAFLTHLAVDEQVSASTQTQALSALLFLYRHVIGREVGELTDLVRARKPRRLPVVLTRDEVKAVLAGLDGDEWLTASLMYASGLRLIECLRLRILDLEFTRAEIVVREGKGGKDPNAPADWRWQWVFPQQCHHHVHETIVQRAMKEAVRRAGIAEHASCCHTLRHALGPICSRRATTSARSRSSLDTRMSVRL